MSEPKDLEEAVEQANAVLKEFNDEHKHLEELATEARSALENDVGQLTRLAALRARLQRR